MTDEQDTYMYGQFETDVQELDKACSESDCTCEMSAVTISRQEYDELVENDRWLTALEAAGVDNWDGYDFAQEIFETFNQ